MIQDCDRGGERTGWNIAHALIREGLVEKRAEGFFIVKFRELLTVIQQQKSWKDLGLSYFGKVVVRSTDPTRSNSGNMFAGLVGVTNDPAVVNLTFMPESIDSVISLPAPKAMHRIVQSLETR